MLDGKSFLGVIPARGGSRGVPRKNLRLVGGKPLIIWTIEAAKKSRFLDRVVFSSEDEELIAVARGAGCEVPFVRPAELSSDETSGMAPALHALSMLPEYDYLVWLQPTSPLRTCEDIDRCVDLCIRLRAPACVSVCRAAKHPHWMYTLGEGHILDPVLRLDKHITRRQELPPVLVLNGAVYVGEKSALLRRGQFLGPGTVGYEMSAERSVDIDTELDFAILEAILAGINRQQSAP